MVKGPLPICSLSITRCGYFEIDSNKIYLLLLLTDHCLDELEP
jgi:hypothetical protein